MRADELRRCQARHALLPHLRCQDEVTEITVHIGPHWAVDRDGRTVRWDDSMAQRGADLANPDRVRASSARLDQVGGEHYRKFKIQPWDIWQEYGLDAFEGAILKYLLRRKGNRLEDLKKARHTLDRLIEIEEGKDGT